jgi:hypothetical protein
MIPATASSGRMGQIFHSVALARKRGTRPNARVRTIGSTNPLKWFATTSTGRSFGMRSRSATSTFRKKPKTSRRASPARARSMARRIAGA